MQTLLTPTQLADPATADAALAIRNCVHCGFCTATCPTYVLLGNELDSPRGRIYLVKEMLEKAAVPSAQVVKHLDRCLSCLACETTCPSGVSYRRIIDEGRAYVETNYRRPLLDRLWRSLLILMLTHRGRFRAALQLAVLARPFMGVLGRIVALRPLATMLRLSAAAKPLRHDTGSSAEAAAQGGAAAYRGAAAGAAAADAASAGAASADAAAADAAAGSVSAVGRPRRIGLMRGCIEPVLDPGIQAATERLLRRSGCEIVRADGEGCCGSLAHHLGREDNALAKARAFVDAWYPQIESRGLDALVLTASGCGTLIRDYGHLLEHDPAYAAKARAVSALACDLSELFERIALPAVRVAVDTVVGYHPACSLQHGQRVRTAPAKLLAAAGFTVRTPRDAHLCCGSAGVYNILQPEIAARLGTRKAETLAELDPDVIATGNIGCRAQLSLAGHIPVVHVAELLDWATGGPRPF